MIKMQKVLDKFKQNANIGAVLHPQHAHNAPPPHTHDIEKQKCNRKYVV